MAVLCNAFKAAFIVVRKFNSSKSSISPRRLDHQLTVLFLLLDFLKTPIGSYLLIRLVTFC